MADGLLKVCSLTPFTFKHLSLTPWIILVYAPSAIPFQESYPQPVEASEEYIASVVKAFEDATERCKQIGFDFIEIHGAHGKVSKPHNLVSFGS